MDKWQTLVAGLLALVAGLLAYIVAQRQLGALKATFRAETMIKIWEKFDSAEFGKKREAATRACLENLETKTPGAPVDDVLDLFEDAAFLVKIGALTEEMMWHSLHYWVRLYWQAAEQHIIATREETPTIWSNLYWVYPPSK